MPGALPAGGNYARGTTPPVSAAKPVPALPTNPRPLPKPAPAIPPTSGGRTPPQPFTIRKVTADYQQISNVRNALRSQPTPKPIKGQGDLPGGDRPVTVRTTKPTQTANQAKPQSTKPTPKTATNKPASAAAKPRPVNTAPQSVGKVARDFLRDLSNPMPDPRSGTGAVVDTKTFSGPNFQYNPFQDSLIPALRTPVKPRPNPAGFPNPFKPAAPAPLTKPQPTKPTFTPKLQDPPPPNPNPWRPPPPAPKPAKPPAQPRQPGNPLGDRPSWPFTPPRPEPNPKTQPLLKLPAPLTQPPGNDPGGINNPDPIPDPNPNKPDQTFAGPESPWEGKVPGVQYEVRFLNYSYTEKEPYQIWVSQNFTRIYDGPVNLSSYEYQTPGTNFVQKMAVATFGEPSQTVNVFNWVIRYTTEEPYQQRFLSFTRYSFRRLDGTTPEDDAEQARTGAGNPDPDPTPPPQPDPDQPRAEKPTPTPIPPANPWRSPAPTPLPPPKPDPIPFPTPDPIPDRLPDPTPDPTPDPPPFKDFEDEEGHTPIPFPTIKPRPKPTNQNKPQTRPKPQPNPRPNPKPKPGQNPDPDPDPDPDRNDPDPTPKRKDETPDPPPKRDRIKFPRPRIQIDPIRPSLVEPGSKVIRPPTPIPPPPRPEPPDREDRDTVVYPTPIPPPSFIDISYPQPTPIPQPPTQPTPPPNLPTDPCENNKCTTAIRGDIKKVDDKLGDLAQLGLQGVDLAILNTINNKLGDQLPGGIGGFLTRFAKSIHLDKVYNGLSLILQIHNAAMLSRNLAESLGFFIDSGMSLLGLKDEEDNPINVTGTIGSAASGFIKSIIGNDLYNGISVAFQKLSAIYGAAMGIIDTLVNVLAGLAEGLEIIGSYTGKIGNSLKKAGVVLESAYSWMDENLRLKTGRFAAIQRVTDGIESAENVVNNLTEVTEISQETIDQVESVKGEFTRIRNLANTNETDKTTGENANKSASQGGTPTPADKLPG